MDQKLQFTYLQASLDNVQATDEGFSPQKKTSSTSQHEISYFILYLWVIFVRIPNLILVRNLDRATNLVGDMRRAYAGNAEWPDVHLALVLSLVHGKDHLENNNNNALLAIENKLD